MMKNAPDEFKFSVDFIQQFQGTISTDRIQQIRAENRKKGKLAPYYLSSMDKCRIRKEEREIDKSLKG